MTAPAVGVPSQDKFWSSERPGYPNLQFLKEHFYHEGRLSEEQAIYIINKGTEIFKQEPNLLHLAAPITGKSIFFFYLAVLFYNNCYDGNSCNLSKYGDTKLFSFFFFFLLL